MEKSEPVEVGEIHRKLARILSMMPAKGGYGFIHLNVEKRGDLQVIELRHGFSERMTCSSEELEGAERTAAQAFPPKRRSR